MPNKLFFNLQYLLNKPPWDTGITPPEVYQYLETHPPGRALDLGCGTGTNVITLAQHGWEVVGVDFVPRAVRTAQRKTRRAGVGDQTEILVADVLKPVFVEGNFDLILDIGCFHSFAGKNVGRYRENVSNLLRPGGSLLLYVHLNPDPGPGHGTRETDLERLAEKLDLLWRQDGEESSRPSAWLEFRKN
jgi:cyclopropane fatty-acyl-phospholipid synthase-like methyltransferase